MSLDHDPRTGHEDSGTVTIAAGDGSTPQTAVDVPDDALFKPTGIKVEYDSAGTTDCDLEVYDEPDGTSDANVSRLREEVRNLSAGNRVEVDNTLREFDNDVLVEAPGGNNDDDVVVTVYGVVLTDLEDVGL